MHGDLIESADEALRPLKASMNASSSQSRVNQNDLYRENGYSITSFEACSLNWLRHQSCYQSKPLARIMGT